MKNKGKYYLTTAIAYTSGKPHIGNTYEIILADAIARFKRQEGYDVFFQTGTDEHGQKIQDRAAQAGRTPKEYVDATAGEVKRIWDLMNTSYDKFIRTTDEDHERQVQKIFRIMHDKGDIYKGEYKGMYCKECESFYTESQLVEGKCPECGGNVTPASEEAYFFKMSKYADRLIEHIKTHPEFIQPESRKNEMMNNFLLPGLQDLCVSRTSFSWGIPVDFDPRHVVYVWLDALTNYITGIGYDGDGNHTELFKKNWPADLHLIGKDIIRFHTIYWPIFLMSLDIPLPKQVFGHPWLLQAGGKMSKSRGNVLYADDLADIFGVDAVRYFVLHEMPYENDGVITFNVMREGQVPAIVEDFESMPASTGTTDQNVQGNFATWTFNKAGVRAPGEEKARGEHSVMMKTPSLFYSTSPVYYNFYMASMLVFNMSSTVAKYSLEYTVENDAAGNPIWVTAMSSKGTDAAEAPGKSETNLYWLLNLNNHQPARFRIYQRAGNMNVANYVDNLTFYYNGEQGGPEPDIKGDVNGDGEVNIADVNVIIDIILGRTVDEKTLKRADVNEDVEINIADVNAVLDIILN